jgi:hypothetical protein
VVDGGAVTAVRYAYFGDRVVAEYGDDVAYGKMETDYYLRVLLHSA